MVSNCLSHRPRMFARQRTAGDDSHLCTCCSSVGDAMTGVRGITGGAHPEYTAPLPGSRTLQQLPNQQAANWIIAGNRAGRAEQALW